MIKVEVPGPGLGDESRGWESPFPFVGKSYGTYPGRSAYFFSTNRNNFSIMANSRIIERQDSSRSVFASPAFGEHIKNVL